MEINGITVFVVKSAYSSMKEVQQNLSFGTTAELYQKYRRSYDPKLYELLFSLLPKGKLSILDIGCGTGKSTEPLVNASAGQEASVTGFDPDPEMLEVARASADAKKLPIEYVQGYAENMPFAPGSFDAVTAGASFHWFANPQALACIHDVLKPGAPIFLFWARPQKSEYVNVGREVYKHYDWKGPPKSFQNKETTKDLLISAGFKNVQNVTIPFVETLTLDHTIGVIKTNSSYLIMDPARQESFVRDMTAAYEKVMGKNKTITEKLELWVYYGIK